MFGNEAMPLAVIVGSNVITSQVRMFPARGRVPPAAAAGNYKIMKSIKIMNLSPAQGYLWDLQTGL